MNNAGRVGFLIKGDYDSSVTYKFLDVVYYNGDSFVAKTQVTGVTPGTDAASWHLLCKGGIVDPTLTVSGAAADAKVTGDEVAELKNDLNQVTVVLPTEKILQSGTENANTYMSGTDGKVKASSSAENSITVYAVNRGSVYKIESDAYYTWANSPAVAFNITDTVTVSGDYGVKVFDGPSESVPVNWEYTPEADGYLWVQKYQNHGVLSVYEQVFADVASQADIDEINSEIESIKETYPTKTVTLSGSTTPGMYMHSNGNFVASQQQTVSVTVYPVSAGIKYDLTSESYSTSFGYPAASFKTTPDVVAGTRFGTLLFNGPTANAAVSESYTPTVDGYLCVQTWGASKGSLTVSTTVQDDCVGEYAFDKKEYPANGLTIAVLGDSIMQNMAGSAPETNEQTYVFDGVSYDFEDLTIVDGKAYTSGGDECTVVNSNQSWYDTEGWSALLEETKAAKIINCGIGGSVINEGILITPYPGVEVGTYRTNSLPNEVRMLKRLIDNGENVPDIVVIWMGTNGLGMTPGDLNEIMSLPWETLSDDAQGHTYRQTVYGGLRYALEYIYRNMPKTVIYVLSPIQANVNTNRTYANLSNRADQMSAIANRLSAKFFRPLDDIGIYGGCETSPYRYTRDGVHPNNYGMEILTTYLARCIKNDFVKKPVLP